MYALQKKKITAPEQEEAEGKAQKETERRMNVKDPEFIPEEQSNKNTYVALGLSPFRLTKFNHNKRKKKSTKCWVIFWKKWY